jgi:hypothetical protein
MLILNTALEVGRVEEARYDDDDNGKQANKAREEQNIVDCKCLNAVKQPRTA